MLAVRPDWERHVLDALMLEDPESYLRISTAGAAPAAYFRDRTAPPEAH
ncbi:MAG: hypothetical protein M3Y83_11355 [Actinomycetota bacterium]|nr:hypothetical protein [Actinomycetota bacterium]